MTVLRKPGAFLPGADGPRHSESQPGSDPRHQHAQPAPPNGSKPPARAAPAPKEPALGPRPLTMFFSFPAHFRKICSDWPACSIPGVANTTFGANVGTVRAADAPPPSEPSALPSSQHRGTLHPASEPEPGGTPCPPSCTGAHHGSWAVSKCPVKGLDVLELEHVPLYKGLPYLLVGPGDEEFVVVIGLLCQARGEVNGGF